MGGATSPATAEGGGLSRREFLRMAGGATAAATVATGTAGGQDGETHTVEMTNQLVFDPDELTIAPGDTVVWENVGTVPHTVTAYAGDIPEEAEYFASGGFESEEAAREAYPPEGAIPGGETYERTFEVEGEYDYFCIPHEQAGMVAQLTVAGGGGAETPAEGPAGVGVPEGVRSVVVATSVGFASVLLFAYFFVKYGGTYEEA